MKVEQLGRRAVEIIKQNWGLPQSGLLAGGSIANIVWELVSGNKAVVNDIDVFHFNGVTEYIDNRKDSSLFNYKEIENKCEFNLLVAEERVSRIIEKINFYGTDNGIIRGLIFCSRKDEAYELSNLFNQFGYKTVALTGDSSET
jgi:superfamily II DNA or RNA helicase